MPVFPKPKFNYQVNLSKEIKAIRNYRNKEGMQIPASNNTNLLLATWNIANLGAQDRKDEHLKIIAEIISWFDIIAVQETRDNSEQFQKIATFAGKQYRFIFSDAAGNNERMAFIYNNRKIKLIEEIAELAVPPSDYGNIKLPAIKAKFSGFDRYPFLVSFQMKSFRFSLLNVHLYYGDATEHKSIERRCLEAFCVGRWANLRSKGKYSYTGKNIFALGDFNLPKVDESDPVHSALVNFGLQLPEHTSKIYSNLNNDKAYDQIAFLPAMKNSIVSHGIFPFDNALFAEIYKNKTHADFRDYIKYYISDHRPMWMELNSGTQ